VPWLTDERVVDQLIQFRSCCIVVDKGCSSRTELRRLAREGPGLHIDEVSSSIYRRPGSYVEHFGEGGELESARVAGWRGPLGKPRLHAKTLLLGRGEWHEVDTGEGTTFQDYRFTPQRAWFGSANLTTSSRSHAELGCWTEGEHLGTLHFWLARIIVGSEPLSSVSAEPDPELHDHNCEPDWSDINEPDWRDEND
jgi:hypothetical protein